MEHLFYYLPATPNKIRSEKIKSNKTTNFGQNTSFFEKNLSYNTDNYKYKVNLIRKHCKNVL